ncbi:MAG: hypothetical protein M3Y33_07150 [Actinomycetota bacterium]|nr:hypothetical protein [Actinomycetota bacterium]
MSKPEDPGEPELNPGGLPFSHDATSLAAAEMWNLICADGEFSIFFHPSGFAGGYAELVVNAHHLRVGEVDVVIADAQRSVVRARGLTAWYRPLVLMSASMAGRRRVPRDVRRRARPHSSVRCVVGLVQQPRPREAPGP